MGNGQLVATYRMAARRLGYDSLDNVKCIKCGLEQYYYYCPKANGKIRYIESHHIYPIASFPELKYSPANITFLCHHCHFEFHQKFDKRTMNRDKSCTVVAASAEDLSIFLDLTQMKSVNARKLKQQVEFDKVV